MTDAGLREAFAELPARAAGTAACPAPDALWDAAAGGLSVAERGAVIDHTASCADCALAWRVATDLGAGARTIPRRAPGRPGTAARYLAVAAAVLLVAVGIGVVRRPPPPPAYRTVDAGTVTSKLLPDASLPRDEFRLEWSAGAPATLYDLRVSNEDLEILHRATTLVTPHVVVPAEALAALPDGSRVLWQVEVVLPDGRRIASDTFAVRVTRGAGRR